MYENKKNARRDDKVFLDVEDGGCDGRNVKMVNATANAVLVSVLCPMVISTLRAASLMGALAEIRYSQMLVMKCACCCLSIISALC